MKKLKVIGILLAVALMVFGLVACGKSDVAPSGSGNQNNGGNAPAAATEYEVGTFNVSLPKGWVAFPQTDIFGDKDENGSLPLDEETILLAKGADDEWDAMSAPNIRIYYYSKDAIVIDSRDFYEDVTDIEGVVIGGKQCTAFSGNSLGYVYDFISYETDDAQYEIQILTSIDGKDTGINWESDDVQQILNSIVTTAE